MIGSVMGTILPHWAFGAGKLLALNLCMTHRSKSHPMHGCWAKIGYGLAVVFGPISFMGGKTITRILLIYFEHERIPAGFGQYRGGGYA